MYCGIVSSHEVREQAEWYRQRERQLYLSKVLQLYDNMHINDNTLKNKITNNLTIFKSNDPANLTLTLTLILSLLVHAILILTLILILILSLTPT